MPPIISSQAVTIFLRTYSNVILPNIDILIAYTLAVPLVI